MNVVLSFRLYHESKGVGASLSGGRLADLCISSERDTARRFLWFRECGIGAGPLAGSVQNQMDD